MIKLGHKRERVYRENAFYTYDNQDCRHIFINGLVYFCSLESKQKFLFFAKTIEEYIKLGWISAGIGHTESFKVHKQKFNLNFPLKRVFYKNAKKYT